MKQFLKGFLSIILLVGLSFVFFACNDDPNPNPGPGPDPNPVVELNSISITNTKKTIDYVEAGTTFQINVSTDPVDFETTFTYDIMPVVTGISVNSSGLVSIGSSVLKGTVFNVRVRAEGKSATLEFTYGVAEVVELDESGQSIKYVKGDGNIVMTLALDSKPISGVVMESNVIDENGNLGNADYELSGTRVTINGTYLDSLGGGDKTITINNSKEPFIINIAIYDKKITTVEELAAINDSPENKAKSYLLANNLDLTDYLSKDGAGYNDGAGWIPIGSFSDGQFSGLFDGDGHIIKNLYMNAVGGDKGFFGSISVNGEVKNLGLVDGFFTTTGNFSGVFAGFVYGKITNCYVYNVTITGARVNGFMGKDDAATKITNCYSAVNPIGSIGGLFGEYCKSSMVNCFVRESGSETFLYDESRPGDWSTSGIKTDAELKTAATYSDWKDTLFVINDGKYPYLKNSLAYQTLTDVKMIPFNETVSSNFFIPVKVKPLGAYNDLEYISDNTDVTVSNGYVSFDRTTILSGTTFKIKVKASETVYDEVEFTIDIPVNQITIDNESTSINYNSEGTTVSISHTVTPLNAIQDVTYSLKESVAGVSINQEGLVTIAKEALDGITFTVVVAGANEKSAELTFTYGYAVVESITITNEVSTIGHQTLQITASVLPWNSNQAITYSLKAAVTGVEISSTGLITVSNTVNHGTTFIVVVESVNELTDEKEFTVNVGATEVEITNEESSIARVGGGADSTFQIAYQVLPSTALQTVTFSLKESVEGVSVSNTGLVTVLDSVSSGTQFTIVVTAASGVYDELELAFDSELKTFEITNKVMLFELDSLTDVIFNVEAVNVTVASISGLESGLDYEIAEGNIVIKASYLNTLSTGDHVITIVNSLSESNLYYVGIKVANKILKTEADVAGMETFGADKYYVLANNITMENTYNESFVTNFTGTLDGNGFRIDGFNIRKIKDISVTNQHGGFFQIIKEGALVKNLSLGGKVNSDGNHSGGFAYQNYGTIENCYVDTEVKSPARVGGIVYDNYGTIKNTIYTGLLIVGSSFDRVGYFSTVNRPIGVIVDSYVLINPNMSSDIVNSSIVDFSWREDAGSTTTDSGILTAIEYVASASYENYNLAIWNIVEGQAPVLINNCMTFSIS